MFYTNNIVRSTKIYILPFRKLAILFSVLCSRQYLQACPYLVISLGGTNVGDSDEETFSSNLY